jgi:hypothetical protein
LKKFDGVIEAVRYKDGKIAAVRAFERRGATWSDRIIIGRDELLKRVKDGKKFVTGQRIEFMAGTFQTGAPVQVITRGDGDVLATGGGAQKDELEGVPVF